MARTFINGHLVESVSDNMGADLVSDHVMLDGASGWSVEVHVDNTSTASTGTAAGTVYIQASNSGTNWDNLANGSISSGTDYLNIFQPSEQDVRFVRVFWDRTGGNGIMNVYFHRRMR